MWSTKLKDKNVDVLCFMLAFVSRTWQEMLVSNMDTCPSVEITNILKKFHVFLPKINVHMSIPMSDVRVLSIRHGTQGKESG